MKKGDVLVSTVRPNRNAVTLIEKNDNVLVCSSGFAVIGPKESTLNHYYIFAYYKTRFVKKLLERCTTATEYPAVTWQDVLNLPFYSGSKGFISLVSK
ncbi:MAG: hypothetical protein NZ853_10480, partial [Leptospiraceae bacterium]|nr:hypothetical protein [Leptospiraceae bacterium]